MTRTRRRVRLTAATLVALLISGWIGLDARADAVPTGRDLALATESRCGADKTRTFHAMAGDRATVLGRWITIEGPTFGVPPGETRPPLTAHAVDPADPRRMLVSEGRSIHLSEDGGCTWRQTFRLPDPQVPIDTTLLDEFGTAVREDVRQIEMARGVTYAVIAPAENHIGAARVLVSEDGGASWEDRSDGLPSLYTRNGVVAHRCPDLRCATVLLAVAPSEPRTAYLAITDDTETTLFATTDAGATWSSAPGPPGLVGEGTSEVVVSSADPRELWGVFAERLVRSRDAGRSWEFPGALIWVAGVHVSDAPVAQIQVLRRHDQWQPFTYLVHSADGGATFTERRLATPLLGIPTPAPGGAAEALVLSTDGPNRALQLDPTAPTLVDIAASGLGHVTNPKRDRTPAPVHWFRQNAGIAAFVPGAVPLPSGRKRLGVAAGSRRLSSNEALSAAAGSVVPEHIAIEVETGDSREVDYRVELPGELAPVDVWFLLDGSRSMYYEVGALREGLHAAIEQMSDAGIDARFGLANFPSYYDVYDREVDLSPPGEELYAAVDRLAAESAGDEFHTTALYQSVTGAGQASADIPPGRGASFRPDALKVIVHATDEPYEVHPDGPSTLAAVAALQATGVRHIGLDFAGGATDLRSKPDEGGLRSLKRDHDAMARGTGTVAPPGGVDCNGDGIKELAAGDLFTCPILRDDKIVLGPALIAAVKAARHEARVELRVLEAAGVRVEVEQAVREAVDIAVPNSLPFPVRFSCPPQMTGRTVRVVLQVRVSGAVSGYADAEVTCALPDVLAGPPAVPAQLVPLALGWSPAVANVEALPPPTNQSAPGQLSQAAPQAGVASQPGQAEPARQRVSRRSSADGGARDSATTPGAVGTLGAGAVLSVALGGWAVRRERRPAIARS